MPTIQDVATRLKNAKVFTVLEAKNGFWQVVLDDKSSFLTTFNTPLGDTDGNECHLEFDQLLRFGNAK